MRRSKWLVVAGAAALATLGGCRDGVPADGSRADGAGGSEVQARTVVTIATADGGTHRFDVERARTPAEQEQGLMYRPSIPENGGMLFAPYPAGGGPARAASFWMKNTPSALDIVFIRPDGTIATIAEDTIPYSTTPYGSGEPVSAVLELRGGRAAELGIAPGDRVRWE